MKIISKRVKRLTCVLIAIAILFGIYPVANATIAPCTYNTGHITYRAANVGGYSSTLSSAVTRWNNAAYIAGCSAYVSLTAQTLGVVDVYYTTTDIDWRFGEVKLYGPEVYEEPVVLHLTDAGPWVDAECYIYYDQINAYVVSDLAADAGITCTSADGIMYVTLHELGHILGLMHPDDASISATVMRSGVFPITVPTTYDRDSLVEQWG